MKFRDFCDGDLQRMKLFRPALLLLLAWSASGCIFLNKFRPVTRTMTRMTGPTGWYRVTPLMGVDLEGNPTIPPREVVMVDGEPEEQEDDEDYDEDTPLVERLQQRFARQLSPLIVTKDASCQYLSASQEAGRPVYILVHGVRGPGPEWWPIIPTLKANNPEGIFLFRWNVTQHRAAIIESLVTGINRIAACHPSGTPVVLAHSAGGVVMSFAVSHLSIEAGNGLDVFTVASPLSGAGIHQKEEDEDGENRFMKDLGATKTGFPAAAPNVRVTHFRTQFPGDTVMEPKFAQHAPNQAGVGVKGATEIDLPDNLTHDGSLLFVARRLVTQ
jgi:hypothetical protein